MSAALGAPRIALVTGAASGMGRLAARRLAAAGTTVAAVDVSADALEATEEPSGRIRPFPADVTLPDVVARVVDEVETTLGPIDRVVHAAGICRPGLALPQSFADVERVMAVNFFGTVHVAQAVLPRMVERGAGDLVLFASLAGWLPSTRLAAYNASKFAVVAWSEVLAHEHAGTGVRFAVVCPPVVATPMVDGMQATDPFVLGGQRGIDPAIVLDAIDRGLERGDLFVFPGRGTRTIQRLRRLRPALLWRQIERSVPAR